MVWCQYEREGKEGEKQREGNKTQLSFSSQRPMRLRVMIKRRRAMEKEKGRERRKGRGRGRERSPIRGDFPGWRCCFPPFHLGKGQACNFGTSRIRSWTDTQDTLSPVAGWQGQCCISQLQSSIQLSFTALDTLRTAYCPPVPGWSLPRFSNIVRYYTVRYDSGVPCANGRRGPP